MEKDQALKFMHQLLNAMVEKKASDLFITAGFPPAIKMDGRHLPGSEPNAEPAAHGRDRARDDE